MLRLEKFVDSKSVEKSVYESVEKDIQERLYLLFSEAHKQQLGTLIALEGFAGAGKGELLKAITTRLDPRKVRVHSMEDDQVYSHFPFMYQFWQKLPPFGETTIYEGSWYRKLIVDRIDKKISKKQFLKSINSILQFEEMISKEKYIIFKFFLNISPKEQKKRFKKAQDEGKNWMVSSMDAMESKNYSEIKCLYEDMLSPSNLPVSPWVIVPSKDKYFTRIHVMESIIEKLENRLSFDSNGMLSELKNKESKEL
jgi:polyphosphate kinase 2 (PPK2 family)